MMRKALVVLIASCMLFTACTTGQKESRETHTSDAIVTAKTKHCLQCHTKKQPSIVASWRTSEHAEAGIGCFECHQAQPGDPDAIEHFDNLVAAIVSPKDCSRCHQAEAEQFLASHHAKGGEVLGSLDNYLGEVVEGFAASVSGCQQCHGSQVVVLAEGKLSPETWPNFGIGRMNPDGTSGCCTACHSRHDFSLVQARSPETCSRCHLGPDHPQKEVYEESKHNIAYRSHMDEMHMDRDQWVVGSDYTAAPTCATCHVSATLNQSRTHDIGLRLSWNIRAPISSKTEEWKRKRLAMKDVCMSCHNPVYVDNFYTQYDAGIDLYNNKFAKPAKLIMDRLKEGKRIDPTPFNEKIEWTYFYLWHHEGRRARNGIAMMGPDYVQWHGFYDIAERFYIEMIPEAEELKHGITKDIMKNPDHVWFSGAMTKEERDRITKFYKDKYGTSD